MQHSVTHVDVAINAQREKQRSDAKYLGQIQYMSHLTFMVINQMCDSESSHKKHNRHSTICNLFVRCYSLVDSSLLSL